MPDFLFAPNPNLAASDFIASKPAVSRAVFDRLLPELKARAFTVTGIQAADVLQGVRDAIATLPQGGDWDAIKRDIAGKISPYFVDDSAPQEDQDKQRAGAQRRAELLLRTHGQQAYAAAQYGMLNEQREVFPNWQYMTLGDSHVRPTHAALDGIVLPSDHEFWRTHFPPWDWGCRCQCIPLSRHDTEKMKQADAKKAPDQQRVLSDYAQADLTTSRRLVRNGVTYNMTAPREEGKPGAYAFHPGDLRITSGQLKARYAADIYAQFEAWAKAQRVEGLANNQPGAVATVATVWDWMEGLAVHATAPAPVGPPAPRTSPVSQAIQLAVTGPLKSRLSRTLDIVDGQHDDGALTPMPVNRKLTSSRNLGEYRSPLSPLHHWKLGPGIGMAGGGSHPEITFVHELGHALDELALPSVPVFGRFASALATDLAPWRAAAFASPDVAMLRWMAANAAGASKAYAEYLSKTAEIWARAYAQYIAIASQDPILLGQLRKMQGELFHGVPLQWSDADFAPIFHEIETLFTAKGWRP